jgi:DNA-binding transcriptional LysR family regulator
VLDWLDYGAADVGVVHLPAKGLATAVLGEQEIVAVLPTSHSLSAAEEVTYTQIASEPFIQCGCGCGAFVMSVARRLGVYFKVQFQAREIAPTLEMVGAELGVSVLPGTGLPELPKSVILKPLTPKPLRQLGLAVSASASLAARAFIDYVGAPR